MNHSTNPVLLDTYSTAITAEELNSHFGYIYRITNKLDGRIYVGLHEHKVGEAWWESNRDSRKAYTGSGNYIKKDMAQLGAKHFEKALLQWVDSKIDARVAEAIWIERAFATGAFYNNSNANSAAAIDPEAALVAAATRRSYDSREVLNDAVRAIRQAQESASTLAEKSSLQRDLLAHLLAIGIQHDRTVRERTHN